MELKVKIYYWRSNMWFHVDEVDEITALDIMSNHERVANATVPDGIAFDDAPDWAFQEFNLAPRQYIVQLPPGVHHTSMSVGDAVMVELEPLRRLFMCLPCGWKELY